MRATISLDDRIGKAAKRRAAAEGLSFSAFIARLIQESINPRTATAKVPPFRLVTVGGGGPRPGVNLDRTSALLLDDDEQSFGSR